MRFDFTLPSIYASSPAEKKAAGILSDALRTRTGVYPELCGDAENAGIIFEETSEISDRDAYKVKLENGRLTLSANGIRGLIYAVGLFLRKTVYTGGKTTLLYDISGYYAPEKKIRGHQLGYRPCSNTYDAWDEKQFEKYCIELMFFGMNTVEHIPQDKEVPEKNVLMKYEAAELLEKASVTAAELGLDVSLWYPNSENDEEKAVANRIKMFERTPVIDQLFVPGSDPGDLPPEELFSRLEKFSAELKKRHPDAQVYPSAQAPHDTPEWGDGFIEQLKNAGTYVDGIITGPNHAFDLDTLRRKTPARFPIRFYPDITHNVRCEYPVHFDRDDWHYALAATLSRESPNPRPCEYRTLHRLTSPYVIGSVSYSEGVNDDVNKVLWSALDYDPSVPTYEILEDYSRLFFPGADASLAADGLFGLEKNWDGAPDENPQIDATLSIWQKLGRETPGLSGSWRYLMCLFRAECDAFVRKKMIFENRLIARASRHIRCGELRQAENILNTPFEQDVLFLRDELGINAKKLFELIGIQLDCENYHASAWDRGAVLETVDRPVTDRSWLLYNLGKASAMPPEEAKAYMLSVIDRNKVKSDEYYYSLALDGFIPLGIQPEPGFYMDFQGDSPVKNNGTRPVCLQKLFDHFVFRARVGGLTSGKPYQLTVTYKNSPDGSSEKHRVSVNGTVIYEGKQFGGSTGKVLPSYLVPDGFIAVTYDIPEGTDENGCVLIEISEPTTGFEIAEFRITGRATE